jgi:HEAT repeat protein
MKDEEIEKRQEAVLALCAILKQGNLHVDPWWHAYIARVLGNAGPEAKSAVPTLKTLTADEDERVREAASRALEKIDPEGFRKLKQ